MLADSTWELVTHISSGYLSVYNTQLKRLGATESVTEILNKGSNLKSLLLFLIPKYSPIAAAYFVLNYKTGNTNLPFELVRSSFGHLPAYVPEYIESLGWPIMYHQVNKLLHGDVLMPVSTVNQERPLLFYQIRRHMSDMSERNPTLTIKFRIGDTPKYSEDYSVVRYTFEDTHNEIPVWGAIDYKTMTSILDWIKDIGFTRGMDYELTKHVEDCTPLVEGRPSKRSKCSEHVYRLTLLA